MEGAHDLGGVGGFGPVRTPGSDATHVEPWELRAQWLALAVCRGARPWIERIDTPTYLTTSYYGRWLMAAEMAAVANMMVTVDEIAESRARIERGDRPTRADDPEQAREVAALLATHVAVGTRRSTTVLRRCCGCAEADVGTAQAPPLPALRPRRSTAWSNGSAAMSRSPVTVRRGAIEAMYTIRFESSDVWGGATAEAPFVILVDLWESYLEPA